MMKRVFLICACALVTQFQTTQGHGYLMDPPARSSLWREFPNFPKNYDDHQLNCGGYYNQWGRNRGKCGICGDPYQDPQPRENESGGKFGRGFVSRSYTAGQVVSIKISITANHLGWFEFRLCPSGSPSTPVTQDCLDRFVLPLADGSGQRYNLGSQSGVVAIDVKLPDSLTCSQCVLQWRWHAGNNFGEDENGRQCKGCGPQEEFYGCSDISIGNSGSGPTAAPITYAPATNAPIRPFPSFTTAPPITLYPPVTGRPTAYPFQPISFRPYTNAPPAKPTDNPNSQVFPTFMQITFPRYTNAPVTVPPPTRSPFQPITLSPNQQPTMLPTGFVPISPAPATNPVFTPMPTASRPFSQVTYIPPTPRPQVTSRPITFYRPPATRPSQSFTTRRTNPPVTFYRPPSTQIPHVVTTRRTNPPVTFYRPPSTSAPIRSITPATFYPTLPPATRPSPRTTPPTTPSVTYKPIVFNLGGGTTRPSVKPQTNPPVTSTFPTSTAQPLMVTARYCYAINAWLGDPVLDKWCSAQCNRRGGTCPAEMCECK